MAGNVKNTLYPPYINTFMPAFPYLVAVSDAESSTAEVAADARVYFSISNFNSLNDIQEVQVSLVNQKNNLNAFKDPTGIMLYRFHGNQQEDKKAGYDDSVGMYYVDIPADSLINEIFVPDQFYKVQIRFSGVSISNFGDGNKTNYLTNNLHEFSEWSSVCLIRPINRPIFYLKQQNAAAEQNSTISFNVGLSSLVGSVDFNGGSETLQSYKISVLSSDREILRESPIVFTGDQANPNEVNYLLDLQGLTEAYSTSFFLLKVDFVSRNQYQWSETYNIVIAPYMDGVFEPVFDNFKINEDEGLVSFDISFGKGLLGNLYVRRTSSLSNFKEWETLTAWENKNMDEWQKTIVDNTVSNHVWYKYSVQYQNAGGTFSDLKIIRDKDGAEALAFLEFETPFLSRLDRQLGLRYNFKVSSVKPMVSRVKFDTLGGKYPKFAENATLGYKQFSISGTISAEADYHQFFLNKQEYFGDRIKEEYYDAKYIKDYGIELNVRNDTSDWIKENGYDQKFNDTNWTVTTLNDWFWERIFREELITWLNDGEPKLFRSLTEGTMPVMLMDVNLTPKGNLNNFLYDFSATMYEIGDASSLNSLREFGIVEPLNIVELGTLSGEAAEEYYSSQVVKVGQLYQYTAIGENNNLAEIAKTNVVNSYSFSQLKYPIDVKENNIALKEIRLFFHSAPYPCYYYQSADSWSWTTDLNVASESPSYDVKIGYLINIDGTFIFVNNRGYYQTSSNIEISNSIKIQNNDCVTMEYLLVYNQTSSTSSTVAHTSLYKNLIGQLYDVYEPNVSISDKINQKYLYVSETIDKQELQYWSGMSLNVNPYSVFSILYAGQEEPEEVMVGGTGLLNLAEEYEIIEMFYLGRRMFKKENDSYLESWEYKEGNIEDTPYLSNHVYDINGKKQFYCAGHFYDCKEESDATLLVKMYCEGFINYSGNVVRLTYMNQ